MAENDAPEQGINFNETEWEFLAAIDALEHLNFDTSMVSVRDDAAEIATIIARHAQRADLAAPDAAQDEVGLNLFRQLVSGHNALRDLDVFACNSGEHDAGCECFWEQCEAWAAGDATAKSSDDDAIRQARRETWEQAIVLAKCSRRTSLLWTAREIEVAEAMRSRIINNMQYVREGKLPDVVDEAAALRAEGEKGKFK